jgi:hypothetical protein
MNEEEERKYGGDWYIVSIDGIVLRAKIVNKSRGKYRIVDDAKDGKYINRIVDAEDIMQEE